MSTVWFVSCAYAILAVIPFCGCTEERSAPAEIDSIYLNNRIAASDKRFASFKTALQLLEERGAKTLVETGTARYGDKQFTGDGGSTIIFGDWAAHHEATLYSIDNSSTAIDTAKSVTQPMQNISNFLVKRQFLIWKSLTS